jgi:hypothetical protein
MSLYLEEWKKFIDKVVHTDILATFDQKQVISRFIKNPLPLDRVNVDAEGAVNFFEQLVRTSESVREKILCSFVSTGDPQLGRIFCASGATGMGKTHIAYVLGKSRYTIIVRVIEHIQDHQSGRAPLTEPWKLLNDEIAQMHNVWKEFRSDRSFNSDEAEIAIYLLLLCYLDLSLIAIEHLTSITALSDEQRMEALLRVHRNGKAEKIVKKHFESRLKELKNGTESIVETLFVDYYADICDRKEAINSEINLCIDEIQALESFFPDLFVHREQSGCDSVSRQSAYQKASSNSSDFSNSTNPQSTEEKTNMDNSFLNQSADSPGRGFVYGMCYVLSELCGKMKISTLITGTSFRIHSFYGTDYSPIKTVVQAVDHLYLMNELQVKDILFHYFDIEEMVKENKKLQEIIRFAVGRPNLYMIILMRPLWKLLYGIYKDKKTSVDILTADQIYEAWKSGIKEALGSFKTMFTKFFEKKPITLDHNPDLTSRTIFSAIAHSYFFNGGGVTNVLTEQIVIDAIKFGLLPLPSTTDKKMIDPTEEPLLFNAFERYLFGKPMSQDTKSELLTSVSGLFANFEKGKRGELCTVLHIALTVLQSLYKKSNRNEMDRETPTTSVTLKQILLPFFDNEEDFPAGMFPYKEWYVSCNCIKDLSENKPVNGDETTRNRSFLRQFVKNDGSYDFSSILWNVENRAGVDIAFLVHDSTFSNHRVVVIQVKNRLQSDIPSALLSLHPALQYLSVAQRKYMFASVNNKKKSQSDWVVHPNMGFLYHDFEDHRQLCSSAVHSPLMTNWIRLCMFAQPLSSSLLRHVKNEIYDLKKINVMKNMFSFGSSQQDPAEWKMTMESSPVIFGNLHSKNFLNEKCRNYFVSASNHNLHIPTTRSIWKPVEFTNDVIQLFIELEKEELNKRAGKKSKKSTAMK